VEAFVNDRFFSVSVPASLTGLLQPLDTNFFGPLKQRLRTVLFKKQLLAGIRWLTPTEWQARLSEAVREVLTSLMQHDISGHIKEGFEHTGLTLSYDSKSQDTLHLQLPNDHAGEYKIDAALVRRALPEASRKVAELLGTPQAGLLEVCLSTLPMRPPQVFLTGLCVCVCVCVCVCECVCVCVRV
jgi:hypothetical protein